MALGRGKERILLLNPPGKHLYARDKYCTSISKASYYWPQIDLLVLSGRLKDQYNVTLIDAIVEGLSPRLLFEKLSKETYKAIIFLTNSASLEEDFEFIHSLKEKYPKTEMIGNGGFLLMRGEHYMKQNDFLDAVLLDFTTECILDYLSGKRPVEDMITRTENGIVRGDRRESKPFSYPFPAHEQLKIGKYMMPVTDTSKLTVTITSIGCRYNCTFCIPATIPYKQREMNNVIEELSRLQDMGFKHVVFHDSNFASDRDYVFKLCEKMISNKNRLTWTCQTRVDTVDDEILAIMKKAGCKTIEFGVESGDDTVLKEMNKKITLEQIRTAFKAVKKHKIRTVGFFILGMPGETKETIGRTIDLAIELDCDYASFSLPMPHPGTRLGESVRKNGWVLSEREMFDDVSRPVNIPSVDHQMVWKMRALAYKKFYIRPRYILKRLFGTRTLYEFALLVRVFLSIVKRIMRQYK